MGALITSTEYYNSICDSISREIAKCTPQLFSVKNHISKLPPAADSTSVLITVQDRHFLVTAAHCVHEFDLDYLGIMIGNDFCTIGGQLKYFEPNDLDDCDPNKIDLAVFELLPDTAGAIREKYQFLNWDRVETNHSSSQASLYLIFGYPEVRTEKKYFPDKIITPTPLVLRTIGVPAEYYLHENINERKTIVLTLDQRKVGSKSKDKIEALPFLGGVSGCGVWNVFNLFGMTPQYRLVSFLTGENASKTVLYSSRADNLKTILITQFGINM